MKPLGKNIGQLVLRRDLDEPHLAILDDLVGEVLPNVDVLGSLTAADNVVAPFNMFRHKRLMQLDELSGRITGRLGCTWPTTTDAIGGTATLALRYSIISASAAARTRPQ